jgi:hypothetical protein
MTGKQESSPESVVREIERQAHQESTAEEKIRIVLEGLWCLAIFFLGSGAASDAIFGPAIVAGGGGHMSSLFPAENAGSLEVNAHYLLAQRFCE